MPIPSRTKRSHIASKFILWFLTISIIPLILATLFSYHSSKRFLEQEISRRLLAVADTRTLQVETYFRDKERALTQLALMPDITDAIKRFDFAVQHTGIESPEYQATDEKYRPLITYYQKSFGYRDLLLVSGSGTVIYSVTGALRGASMYEMALVKTSALSTLFLETVKSSRVQTSDFIFDDDTRTVTVYFAAPVFEGGSITGVVIAHMATESLAELARDYSGLGTTGEVVLATTAGERVSCLTPLRFAADAPFNPLITQTGTLAVDIRRAMHGSAGTGPAIDYRGAAVLAVWRALPAFKTAIIVKMDKPEIFAPSRHLRNTLMLAAGVLLIGILFIAIVLARSISRPINALTTAAASIAAGTLSQRAPIMTSDEIGTLAQAFNTMTDGLVQAKAHVEEERETIRKQKTLLEKANQELDTFVYTVSHDLRAPLRAILRFSDFCLEDYRDRLDEEGQSHLLSINKGARRMNQLIDDLLTLSRIARIQNPFDQTPIKELIESVIERLKFDIREHNVLVILDQGLPVVCCDRIKIEELFFNLISNAIKFSSRGNSARPRVEIGYRDTRTHHEFFVRDNGIGIEPEYHQEIFQIFRRLHTADTYEGTGAGLTIVKRIVDDHHGNIWVDSAPGQGATFHFTIPKDLRTEKTAGDTDLPQSEKEPA